MPDRTSNGHRKGAIRQRLLMLALLVAGMSPAAAFGQGRPPSPVRVDAVRSEQLAAMRKVTGDVQARLRSSVAAREPGVLLAVHVEEGQSVERGALIAELDVRKLAIERVRLDADLAVTNAQIEQAQAQLKKDKDNFALIMESFERGGANAKERNDAQADVAIAQANLTASQRQLDVIDAQIDLIEQRIDDARITAPYDGIIVNVLADPGEWIAEGDAVVELISSGAVEAWINVPQQHLAAMQQARSMPLTLEIAGTRIESSKLRIVPDVHQQGKSFVVVATIANDEAQFAPGMPVVAWTPTSQVQPTLLIAGDALNQNDTGTFVYVVRSTGPDAPPMATPVPVRVLFPYGGRLAVESFGLQPGDNVITEGNERITPMSPVSIIQDGQNG